MRRSWFLVLPHLCGYAGSSQDPKLTNFSSLHPKCATGPGSNHCRCRRRGRLGGGRGGGGSKCWGGCVEGNSGWRLPLLRLAHRFQLLAGAFFSHDRVFCDMPGVICDAHADRSDFVGGSSLHIASIAGRHVFAYQCSQSLIVKIVKLVRVRQQAQAIGKHSPEEEEKVIQPCYYYYGSMIVLFYICVHASETFFM